MARQESTFQAVSACVIVSACANVSLSGHCIKNIIAYDYREAVHLQWKRREGASARVRAGEKDESRGQDTTAAAATEAAALSLSFALSSRVRGSRRRVSLQAAHDTQALVRFHEVRIIFHRKGKGGSIGASRPAKKPGDQIKSGKGQKQQPQQQRARQTTYEQEAHNMLRERESEHSVSLINQVCCCSRC